MNSAPYLSVIWVTVTFLFAITKLLFWSIFFMDIVHIFHSETPRTTHALNTNWHTKHYRFPLSTTLILPNIQVEFLFLCLQKISMSPNASSPNPSGPDPSWFPRVLATAITWWLLWPDLLGQRQQFNPHTPTQQCCSLATSSPLRDQVPCSDTYEKTSLWNTRYQWPFTTTHPLQLPQVATIYIPNGIKLDVDGKGFCLETDFVRKGKSASYLRTQL